MGDAATNVVAWTAAWHVSADKITRGGRRSGGRSRGQYHGTITEDAASMDLGVWTAVGAAAGGRPRGMLLRTRPSEERGEAGEAATEETMRRPRRTPTPWT